MDHADHAKVKSSGILRSHSTGLEISSHSFWIKVMDIAKTGYQSTRLHAKGFTRT
jgi:hypothetical protein